MAKILVTGSLNMDLVALTPRVPVAGETITGTRFFTAPGGKGANQAYAASRLGGDVAMLGRVGEDEFGRQMVANLAGAGCDITRVRAVPGSSGAALICVSVTGENSIVVIPGANHELKPDDIRGEADAFEQATLLLLQLETPIQTVIAAAHAAKKSGATVILDPAPAPPAPLALELLGAVDILTPNETEACILAGLPPARLSAEEAPAVARKLNAVGVRYVVLKLGEQGCLLFDGERTELISAPKVSAVDTTAAGDVFNAGLSVALSEGAELRKACRYAVHASALSVTRLGTQAAAPARHEVEIFVADLDETKVRAR